MVVGTVGILQPGPFFPKIRRTFVGIAILKPWVGLDKWWRREGLSRVREKH